MSKLNVLMVDDEALILQGLKRMLRGVRDQWDMRFAEGGAEGLKLLEESECDVVVSDMRMPNMDGVAFLTQVRQRFPHTIRIILSGYSEQEMTARSVGVAHQYLSKPCDAETLKNTVQRAQALRNVLNDEKLQAMVARIDSLPSPPALYHELMELISHSDTSLNLIGLTIERDPAMTSKILKLVNSSFFGMRRRVTSASQAVSLLGLDLVKSLVLSSHIFTQAVGEDTMQFVSSLWEHSLRTAATARNIMKAQQADNRTAEEAFTAGLLHDLGKLVLVTHLSQHYLDLIAESAEKDIPLMELEKLVIGATHAEMGAYLLGLWGLPDAIVEAVAYHHNPSECIHGTFGVLTATHVANALDYKMQVNSIEKKASGVLDQSYLDRLGLADQLGAWATQIQTHERNEVTL